MMLERTRTSFSDYLTRLQAGGRISFTKDDLKQALKISDGTLLKAVARLRRKLRTLSDAPGIGTVHGTGYRLVG